MKGTSWCGPALVVDCCGCPKVALPPVSKSLIAMSILPWTSITLASSLSKKRFLFQIIHGIHYVHTDCNPSICTMAQMSLTEGLIPPHTRELVENLYTWVASKVLVFGRVRPQFRYYYRGCGGMASKGVTNDRRQNNTSFRRSATLRCNAR